MFIKFSDKTKKIIVVNSEETSESLDKDGNVVDQIVVKADNNAEEQGEDSNSDRRVKILSEYKKKEANSNK